ATAGGWDEAGRKKCRAAWEEWWKASSDKVEPARVGRAEVVLGVNIIAELDGSGARGEGRVWECSADGKMRGAFEGPARPIDARPLPNGRILVAEHNNNLITERDREGKVHWQFRANGQPVSCQRLPNGNTFFATYNEIGEVTPDGKVLSSARPAAGQIYNAV